MGISFFYKNFTYFADITGRLYVFDEMYIKHHVQTQLLKRKKGF